MDILEQIEELQNRYEQMRKELAAIQEVNRLLLIDKSKLPEFGDEKVLSLVLSGRENGKIRQSSIRKLCERGIISRTKVLDKWMFHVPTAIDEFRRHMENEANLYDVDVV